MAIVKQWFKYFDEKRELEQKRLEYSFGRRLTEEELMKITPSVNKRFRLLDIKLSLFSKENDCLIAKFYNDSVEEEIGIYLGIPYLFSFKVDLEFKSTYYKKWFHYLSDKSHSQDTGIRIDKHWVNLSWGYKSHDYEPDLNEGKHFYKSWEEIFKGEKEVFEIISKRNPYTVTKSLTIPYSSRYESMPFKIPFGKKLVEMDVRFTVSEKLFVTRYKRWFPVFSQAYEVRTKGGPLVKSSVEQLREEFSYLMGGDYMTPLDTIKTPEEAITYYIEELYRRL